VQDYETAEDIAQDAFLTAYQKRMDLRSIDHFAGWVKTIAKNLAKRYLKQSSKERPAAALAAYLKSRSPEGADPLRLIERKEWAAALCEAFKQLKHEHRLVLLLKYYLDMSESEMSKVLHIPLGSVKSRLFRAKRLIRRVLRKEWGS
jgi:RNA polymerase sigma-70 factor (ECF subfamily)